MAATMVGAFVKPPKSYLYYLFGFYVEALMFTAASHSSMWAFHRSVLLLTRTILGRGWRERGNHVSFDDVFLLSCTIRLDDYPRRKGGKERERLAQHQRSRATADVGFDGTSIHLLCSLEYRDEITIFGLAI